MRCPFALSSANFYSLAIVLSLGANVSTVSGQQRAIDYNRDVRPILSDNCFFCHGPDAAHREADLRLDQQQGAKADLGEYAVVVAGDAAASEMMARITSTDEPMPPVESGKSLTAKEVATLRRWIDEGAVWSDAWTYLPPRLHELPNIERSDWPLNWVDHFLLARLEQENLTPAAEADRVTLIRRLHFDLIGLPPSPAEVAEFVNDPSPRAYEQLVDRLLASSSYAERMAIYWLDLVRFADTVGYHGDQPHSIWPYRDYVIHAFASNLPFDQFTREQLAGDLLSEPTTDQLIASGYNRLLQTSHEGGVQLKEYRAIYLADRVRNVSQVWMGATLGCAQCHDHKYDPLSTEEFYALGAFFADIDDEGHLRHDEQLGQNTLPTPRSPEREVLGYYQREELAALDTAIAKLADRPGSDVLALLQAERDTLANAKSRTMVSESSQPREVRVLPRGNWLDETGPMVEPNVPAIFGRIEENGAQRATRLDLANWLTAAGGGGGFTARVMVNRFWYMMFGQGIASDLGDFGGQGQPPDHPELLDDLAIEFMASGWNVKHLLKLLVMSRAYRQSSLERPELRQRDPHNRLVARQARYRLPAEMVRDAALTISGLLVKELGGPSVKPYQPAGIYRHLNFPERKYEQDDGRRQWRRGLYVHWQRQFLHPMLKAFDAPSREECTAQRPMSNTPLAALVLLNDPTFVESARVLAASTMAESGDGATPSEIIDKMFLRAVSRRADAYERQLLTELLVSERRHFAAHLEAAREITAIGLAPTDAEADAQMLAAWTGVARAVLNMNETLSRN